MTPAPGSTDREIGVIGGVGPLATVYFLDKIVRLTRAERDQDHLNLVVLQHSAIPDRTEFVLGRSDEDPGPVMARDARRLAGMGVELIVVPCNTAHHFVRQVEAATDVPIISIVAETVAEVATTRPDVTTIGLLATSGTLDSGVYQHAADAHGLGVVVPDDADQDAVMRIIYDQVKAGKPVDMELFNGVVERLLARGAQVVVLGCTELSVIAEDADLLADPRFVDSLDVLARRTILRSGHELV